MTELGKILIGIGALLVLAGGAVFMLGKIPGMGKLPGDIVMKRENFTFYFPFVTCILISLILSFILSVLNKR